MCGKCPSVSGQNDAKKKLDIQSECTRDDSRGLIVALEVTAETLAATLIVVTLAWQTHHYFTIPVYETFLIACACQRLSSKGLSIDPLRVN
jgi:hypothetical protein